MFINFFQVMGNFLAVAICGFRLIQHHSFLALSSGPEQEVGQPGAREKDPGVGWSPQFPLSGPHLRQLSNGEVG